jgi:hypothetical protein
VIRWFIELIYGSTPVEFESSFGLHESVARIHAATVRSVFLSFHKQSAVGRVTEHRVSLQRVIPLVGNSFKPFFVGKFEIKNGHVVLIGRFNRLQPFLKSV